MPRRKPPKELHRKHTDEYGDRLIFEDGNGDGVIFEVAGFLPSKDAPHAITLWKIVDREYTEPHGTAN